MQTDPKDVKILLAEDAKTMRKIEVRILKSLGYTDVIEAEDGLQAKELLQKRKGITLIISDWNMPNMSGFEFLTWIRTKSKKFRELPFILATAQSDKEQILQAEKAGVTCFVAKPFSAEDLQKKIEQALNPVKEKKKPIASGAKRGVTGKTLLRVAHLQITDHLLLGLAMDKIKKGSVKPNNFDLETKLMGSWNPLAEALENNEVDAAFMLAPIAMDLFSHGVPLKTVLLAHRGGSIMVRNDTGAFQEPFEDFFRKKSFLLPHKLSIHHMLSHVFFKGIGLKGSLEKGDDIDVNFEVAAPVSMPDFLQENKQMAGFMVAEPIGSKAIKMGCARKQFMSGEIWPAHPCCVVVMSQAFLASCPESSREFIRLLVESGQEISQNIPHAAQVGVQFLDPDGKLGLKKPLLEKVLTEPHGIRWDNLYPNSEEFEIIREYMHRELGVLQPVNYDEFIDCRFADAVCKKTSAPKTIKFPLAKKVFTKLLGVDQTETREHVSLKQLLFEKGLPDVEISQNQTTKSVKKQEKLLADNKQLQTELSAVKKQLAALHTASGVLFTQGISLLKEERLFEAAGNFNAVLAFDPENLKALNNLAVIYYEMEMDVLAKETLKKIIDLDPENEIAKENLVSLEG